MKITSLVLLTFCFWPYVARADTFPANCSVQTPDTSGWEKVQTSRIEFRMSGATAAYLGLDVEYTLYRNPLDVKEFVKVISRHIPLISQQKKLNEQVILDVATALYTRKEEQDRLNELIGKTDPILFVRWVVKGDNRMRQGQLDKNIGVDIWFLKPSGECLVVKNEKVGVQFLTENVGNGKPKNVFVGVQYRVGDAYHILKVNRDDILLLMNEEER